MATRKHARTPKFANVIDAGFEGEDAFGQSEDEIALEPEYGRRRRRGAYLICSHIHAVRDPRRGAQVASSNLGLIDRNFRSHPS